MLSRFGRHIGHDRGAKYVCKLLFQRHTGQEGDVVGRDLKPGDYAEQRELMHGQPSLYFAPSDRRMRRSRLRRRRFCSADTAAACFKRAAFSLPFNFLANSSIV
jgi:hypothetical protein